MFRSTAAIILSLTLLICSASLTVDGAEFGSRTTSDEGVEELLAMSLEELMYVKVTTASKRSQSISEAPSPIYVFTEEDIKRTGVRSIMELLRFIPGWYVYPRIDQPFALANRGMRSSSNDKTLFLIDGIPLNNISKSGAVNADKFPDLDMVKRVEVINGPGSTMWGSDASLGVISIITKDAKDIDGHVINVDAATIDDHRQLNFLSGKEFEKGEYLVSLTYFENNGFGDKRNGYQNYVHDFGTVPWNDQHATFNHFHPSYEFYGKFKFKDFTLKTLVSEKSLYSFWTTSLVTDWPDKQDKKSIHTTKDYHLELSHRAKLSGDMTLETKLTAKKIDYVRDKIVYVGSNHGSNYDDPAVEPIHNRSEFYPEKGAGLEFILNWDINEKHKLLAGTRFRIVKAGPGEFKRFNIETGGPPSSVDAQTLLYDETTDKTYGAYVEDTFRATDKLTLVGGVRVDYNTPRERTSVVSPRAAVIYRFTDALSAKYMYNTGYFRPLIAKSSEVALSKLGSVDKSEKITANDIALMYETEKTQLIVDLFHMRIDDRNRYDALAAAHVDAGDITSKGIELLFKRSLLDRRLVFDLNYAYAIAETTDRSGNKSAYYEGIPNHLYAAGLTYLFTEQISLNTTVYGWQDLRMNNVEATAWVASEPHPDYNGDYLVDMNLRYADLVPGHLDISLYVLNVFDEDARLQANDDWHAWWSYAPGRSIGTKISYKF